MRAQYQQLTSTPANLLNAKENHEMFSNTVHINIMMRTRHTFRRGLILCVNVCVCVLMQLHYLTKIKVSLLAEPGASKAATVEQTA